MFITKSWLRAAGISAVAAAAFSLAPLSARAGTLSESLSVASTPTNWVTGTNGVPALNFQGFDALATAASLNPAQLILSSVTIALTETMSGTAYATNNGSTSAVGDFVFTNTAKFNAGSLGTVINQQNSQTITIATNATSPTQNIGGSTSASNTYTSNLAQFLPTWTGVGADSGSEGLSFTGGNLSAKFTDAGALLVAVTYNYTPAPVPEPASIVLVGVGLLALGLIRTKRA
jgi:hypothetical protein